MIIKKKKSVCSHYGYVVIITACALAGHLCGVEINVSVLEHDSTKA